MVVSPKPKLQLKGELKPVLEPSQHSRKRVLQAEAGASHSFRIGTVKWPNALEAFHDLF